MLQSGADGTLGRYNQSEPHRDNQSEPWLAETALTSQQTLCPEALCGHFQLPSQCSVLKSLIVVKVIFRIVKVVLDRSLGTASSSTTSDSSHVHVTTTHITVTIIRVLLGCFFLKQSFASTEKELLIIKIQHVC